MKKIDIYKKKSKTNNVMNLSKMKNKMMNNNKYKKMQWCILKKKNRIQIKENKIFLIISKDVKLEMDRQYKYNKKKLMKIKILI